MLTLSLVVALTAAVALFCAMVEAALRTLPVSKLQELLPPANTHGACAVRTRTDRFVCALLAFSTGVTTTGGVLLGAFSALEFNADTYLILSTAVASSLLILFGAQVIGRGIGTRHPEAVLRRARVPLGILAALLSPLILLGDRLFKPVEPAPPEAKALSEQEIIALTQLACEQGAITPHETRLVENALRLGHKTAHQLMTPRTVVYRLPDELPLTMVTAHSDHWTHSRLPLCKDNDPDRVVGLVFRREVFDALLNRPDEEIERMKLSDLSRPVEFIPESLRGDEILQRFLSGRNHLFIVTNEHGGMEGIITLEDVLEELLGAEIVDYHDQHVDMQEYARRLADRRRTESSRPVGVKDFYD